MLKRQLLPGAVALMFSPLLPAVELSDVPLYLAVDMAPNVLLTLDDSGSMAWDYVPDSIKGASSIKRKAASYNGLAYNPRLDYPIPQARGRSYATRFNYAYANGFTRSSARNLADSTYSLWYDDAGLDRPRRCSSDADGNADRQDDNCYVTRTVGVAEQQNYANWYSFYRTRQLSMISGVMQAVEGLDDRSIRLGWQALNTCTNFDTQCNRRDSKLKTLDEKHRSGLYDWLERFPAKGATPLRSALLRAGNYLKNKKEVWWEEPYAREGTQYSCRKSFHVMFTDGMWNKDSINFGGHTDATARKLPDGTHYTPGPPFSDSNSNSLADGAFKFWSEDLSSDLENNIPASYSDRSGSSEKQYWNPKNNPATWQHMVTFSIGLGLGETLVAPNPIWGGSTWAAPGYQAFLDGTSWPVTYENLSGSESGGVGHVYDLWHAAINSRGQFFSADDPKALSEAFRQTFASIIDASPTAAPLASDSGAIQQGSLLYQAGFDSKDWHGQLQAWQLKTDSTLGQVKWDAARQLPAPAERRLFTLNGSSPRLLDSCSSLSDAQLQALGPDLASCNQRLQWLRGDSRHEVRNGGSLRDRPVSVLGDIINSAPAYSGSQDHAWGKAAGLMGFERDSYAAYLAAKRQRPAALFAGANDGMLHGFDAKSGRELFGFIPPAVFDQLKALTEPAYSHRYTVDGSPTLGDAYFGGSWKTVLVGGLNKGGRAVYALNVGDAAGFSSHHVLWQFTDPDLGYSYSQPQLARLNNGDWAAIFGSGYDSARQALFVVRLSDGRLLRKILLPQGEGLASVALHDQNQDGVTDAVYAGDLAGWLWKFDLSATDTAAWRVANQGRPLFVTQPGQAITTPPSIGAHPQGKGVLLYFGSGRYLGAADINNKDVQAFYAVQDKDSDDGITLTPAQLQAQTMEETITLGGATLRKSSSHLVDWSRQSGWMLQLATPDSRGERIITRALLNHGRVFFTTMTPSDDPCVPGGESWLMMLRADTGGRTTDSAFDLNGDGVIDDKDKIGGSSVSGMKLSVGIATAPIFIDNPATPGLSPLYISGTSGKNQRVDISVPPPKPEGKLRLRRIYWKQIL